VINLFPAVEMHLASRARARLTCVRVSDLQKSSAISRIFFYIRGILSLFLSCKPNLIRLLTQFTNRKSVISA